MGETIQILTEHQNVLPGLINDVTLRRCTRSLCDHVILTPRDARDDTTQAFDLQVSRGRSQSEMDFGQVPKPKLTSVHL